MGEVKWIKVDTGLPSNKKIKQLRKLPQGDTIALMWVFLMCLAGETNEDGMVYFTREVPYTEEMLADQFDMEINTVRLGLSTFQRFGMIEIIEDIMCLTSWEKWQATDKLSEIREQTRKRVARHREKQKQIACNVTGNVTVTQCNATEEEKEEETEGDKEKDNISGSTTAKEVVDLYNSICKSYPTVKAVSEARKKAIKARLRVYNIDDFRKVFEMAEASTFLKGGNGRNWTANFDWLIKDANFAKVLDGNYNPEQSKKQNTGYGGQDLNDLDEYFK